MTRAGFSRWWTLSSHTYCSSKAHLMRWIAAFCLFVFVLYCFSEGRGGKRFHLWMYYVESLSGLLAFSLKLDWICHLYMALYQTVMKVQCWIYNTAKIILRLMLNLRVILLEVILKSMTSSGRKRSSIPLKMHQLWSFFLSLLLSYMKEKLWQQRFRLPCLTSLFVSSVL